MIREMLHPAQRRKLGPKAVPGRPGIGKERRDSTIAGGSWPQATAQEREKFGTYYRDATGLDYADQRYYASTSGRFLTADRSGLNEALEDPSSLNQYMYVQGDPINFNDPEGLACKDVVLQAWTGIPTGTTVGELFSTQSNISVFAQTIFAETRIAWDSSAALEKAAVAATVMNRWQFVNGYYELYAGPIGSRMGNRLDVTPGWGRADGTLTSIVFAPEQFAVWSAPGVLEPASHQRFSAAMNSAETPASCLSLLQSIGTAAGFWSARNQHELYISENDLIFTSFQSGADPQKSYYETWIGSYGSANVFAGVTLSQVARPGTVQPKPPPDPEPRRRPRERGVGRGR